MKPIADWDSRNIDDSRGLTADRPDGQRVCFRCAFSCKHVQLNAMLVRSEILFEWADETQVAGKGRRSRKIFHIMCSRAVQESARSRRYLERTLGKVRQNNPRLSGLLSFSPIARKRAAVSRCPPFLKLAKPRSVRMPTSSGSQAEDSAISLLKDWTIRLNLSKVPVT
jgi:hypothetical protein